MDIIKNNILKGEENNTSYTICFLGANSNKIFRDSPLITKDEVEAIAEKAFDAFCNSEEIQVLKIITNGLRGGGVPEVIAKKFAELRELNKIKLNQEGKELQLIAVTFHQEICLSTISNPKTEEEKKELLEQANKSNAIHNIYNDCYIKAVDISDQIQKMISLSHLFVGLPGGKTTLANILAVCEVLKKNRETGDYAGVLLHNFWEADFKTSYEFPKFLGDFEKNEQYFELKQMKVRKGVQVDVDTRFDIASLKDELMNLFVIPFEKREEESPILAVDLDIYVLNNGSEKKVHGYAYSTQTYETYKDNYLKENSHLMFLSEVVNECKTAVFPNGRTQCPDKSNPESEVLQYRERLYDYNQLLEKNVLEDLNKTWRKALRKYSFDSTEEHIRKPFLDRLGKEFGQTPFEILVDFFAKKQYGQTLVWKHIRVSADEMGEIKNESIGIKDEINISLIVLFKYELPVQTLESVRAILDRNADALQAQFVASNFYYNNRLINIRQKETYEQSVNFALSQVFVRNMAHNIISHVLVYLQNFEGLSDEKIAALIAPERKGGYKTEIVLEELQNTSYWQLATLFKYISNRCLYLNEATYQVSNSLESKSVYAELFKEFDENRILLNLISGIDNFQYSLQFLYNGTKITEKNDFSVMLPGGILGQQAFYNLIENVIRNAAKHNAARQEIKEVPFVVSFFDTFDISILSEKYKKLKDYLEETDPEKRRQKEEICELLGVSLKAFSSRDKNYYEEIIAAPEKYYLVCVYVAVPIADGDRVVNVLNAGIDENVIKKGILRSHSLGLLEMKSSAAFLRQEPLLLVDKDNALYKEPDFIPFLRAILWSTEEGENFVGYQFFVKKVEKYLLIAEEDSSLFEKYRDFFTEIRKQGIELITTLEFLRRLIINKSFNQEFVILCGGSTKDKYEKLKEELTVLMPHFYTSHQEKKEPRVRQDRSSFLSLLPERLMYVEETWFEQFFDKKEGNTPSEIIEAFELAVWEQWEGKRCEKIKDNWECFQHIGKNNVEGNSANVNYDCCKQVIFHNHLSNKASWITLSSTIDREKVAVEPLSSAALRKMPQYRSGSFDDYIGTVNYPEKTISPQLIEAYFSKILVIEERIQDFSTEKYPVYEDEGVSQGAIYEATHILLPTKETLDLKANDLKGKTIDEYISRSIQEEKPEFLLIHYGLMERIYGKENGNKLINQRLEEWSKKLRVVVTSGRGKHSLEALPKSVCYLNLSSVLKAFKEDRNKYSIHYILNQARR